MEQNHLDELSTLLKAKMQAGFFDKWVFPFLGGITKREYFAALAMGGLCDPDPVIGLAPGVLASRSVEIADALLAALGE